jgi:hypothetical protein
MAVPKRVEIRRIGIDKQRRVVNHARATLAEVRMPFLLARNANNIITEVQRWQYFLLVKRGIGAVGAVDGGFGSLTEQATKLFRFKTRSRRRANSTPAPSKPHRPWGTRCSRTISTRR